MTQFIELETSYGVPTRVNVAGILRYFRGARQPTTTVGTDGRHGIRNKTGRSRDRR